MQTTTENSDLFENSDLIKNQEQSAISEQNHEDNNVSVQEKETISDEVIETNVQKIFVDNQINTTVSGKGDELNDLISALKAQSVNTVKGGNKNNGKFTSLLKEVLNTQPDVSNVTVKSDILPKSAPIKGLDLNDPFCVLVNSVTEYIRDLVSAKNEFIENNKSKSSARTSHIESISSLISDLSHRNSSDTDVKQSDTPISTDPNEFTLTEQKESEDLSIDEQLRQAQLAALALDEQQKELNEKLKAEAKILNEKVNAEQIINEAEQSLNEFKKTDSEHFVSSDAGLIEFDSSDDDKNESSLCDDNNLSDCYSLVEVSDIFTDNSLQNTFKIRKDIPDLYSVLSQVNSNISQTENVSVCIKKDYSSGLLKAVDDSLSGIFGANKNIAMQMSDSLQDDKTAKTDFEQTTSLPSPEHNSDDVVNIDDLDIEYDEERGSEFSNTTNSKELVVNLNLPSDTSQNTSMLADGNPMNLKTSTLELIEQDQNYENRALGRKLETKDFYPELLVEDDWYKDIINAGYNSGPTYSALCYSNRIKNSEYDWTIQMSSDMNLLLQAPDFHHNLRTKFSIYIGHPVELKLESYKGIPPNCPEDKARQCYLNTINAERKKMSSNNKLKLFIEHLGDDLSTVNLGLYTQIEKPLK